MTPSSLHSHSAPSYIQIDILIIGRNRYVETPMDNLPLDLLRPIVENLADDSRSLLAVSLASRELRMEGQRILFRRVTPPTNKDHHTKFLTAVTSSSLLALLVEEYHQFDLLDRRPEEPFLGLTCRGLQAMVNLKILRLRTSNHPQSFRGCTFQLEALEWNDYPDVEHILDFLRTQLQLRTLRLYWKRPDLDTSGICPRLQLLHGDRSTMNAFLPGRHVTSIKWTPSNGELLNDSVDHLSREFNHIRFFSVGGWWGHHRLNILIPHLGAVEVFELGGLRSLSVPVCFKKFPL